MKKLLFLALLGVTTAMADIKTDPVEYQQGDATLQGWLIYDDAILTKRPGILVVHQWKGAGDYEKKRGEMLARLGYVAFVADIYGKGIHPDSVTDASALAGKYKNDRDLLRQRVRAGLDQLKKARMVDPQQTAAIGYCFGGTTVLELARSGADIDGVVSFHGGLSTPTPEDANNIKAKVLALHGADDPHVPDAEVQAFKHEMQAGQVDWQIHAYGNAVHSFTHWTAGTDNSTGSAYNQLADKRSWRAMQNFFKEIFSDRKPGFQ